MDSASKKLGAAVSAVADSPSRTPNVIAARQIVHVLAWQTACPWRQVTRARLPTSPHLKPYPLHDVSDSLQ